MAWSSWGSFAYTRIGIVSHLQVVLRLEFLQPARIVQLEMSFRHAAALCKVLGLLTNHSVCEHRAFASGIFGPV